MRYRIYKLYGTNNSTANAQAQLTIQARGTIVALQCDQSLVSQADGDRAGSEISFAAVNQVQVNDPVGPISSQIQSYEFTTSGASKTSEQMVASGIAVPVNAGDRIYLHIVCITGTPNVLALWYLHVVEG